jgi:hypothetical protein
MGEDSRLPTLKEKKEQSKSAARSLPKCSLIKFLLRPRLGSIPVGFVLFLCDGFLKE